MSKAIEIWNSLDLSNQTNLECARAWFMEGFAHGQKVKTLTADEKSKLIGTLKWAEDLLRLSCNDEAVNDVQDCLMILKKAQDK